MGCRRRGVRCWPYVGRRLSKRRSDTLHQGSFPPGRSARRPSRQSSESRTKQARLTQARGREDAKARLTPAAANDSWRHDSGRLSPIEAHATGNFSSETLSYARAKRRRT